MKLIRTQDYADMSRKAANLIFAQMIQKPNSVLGLATGSSPVGIYQNLVEFYQNGDLDFSQVRTVNLDEYKGLSKNNPQSYHYFMQENLFRHVNIKPEHTHIPDGMNADSEEECTRYNAIIRELGGIDLQLLGLGLNGHIGFNEPGEKFKKLTHWVTLSQSTIDANSRFFDRMEEVPRYAYSMGIGNIMQARKIVMVVSGESKADILKQILTGSVMPSVPASILTFHSDVTIVADAAACSKL